MTEDQRRHAETMLIIKLLSGAPQVSIPHNGSQAVGTISAIWWGPPIEAEVFLNELPGVPFHVPLENILTVWN